MKPTETKPAMVTTYADATFTITAPQRCITALERQKIRAALDLARRAFDLRPVDENDSATRRLRDRLYLAGVDVTPRPNRHDRRARAAGAEIAIVEDPAVTDAERELLAAVGPVIFALTARRLTGDVRVRAQAKATARALMAQHSGRSCRFARDLSRRKVSP